MTVLSVLNKPKILGIEVEEDCELVREMRKDAGMPRPAFGQVPSSDAEPPSASGQDLPALLALEDGPAEAQPLVAPMYPTLVEVEPSSTPVEEQPLMSFRSPTPIEVQPLVAPPF